MLRRTLAHIALVVGGIVAGVAIVVSAEVALRVLRVGEPDVFARDVDASGAEVARLAWNPQFDKAVPPATERQLPAARAPTSFRIFVIGESSAEGTPYGPAFAFSSWLARRLAAEAPEVHWEVVNAAFAGLQSWSALTIVRDIARWSPDLLVVYLGHNEVGTRFSASERAWLDPARRSMMAFLRKTRLYAVTARALPRHLGDPTIDLRNVHRAGEAFAVIAPGGTRRYATADDRALSAALYRERLAEMVGIMRRAGARTMLLTLSQNFSDWEPAVSLHRPGMRPEEKAAWRRLVREGDGLASHDCAGALAAWTRALALDDGYALLHYKMARCERALGRIDEARARFRLASDLDGLPQGASTSFNDILREVARRDGAILVDVDTLLAQVSGPRLVGDDLFVDAVHPNIRAHQLIADAVARAIRTERLAGSAVRWREDAYVDPDPDALIAADPELRTRELISRALCYQAGARPAAALDTLRTAARVTRDPATREKLERAIATGMQGVDARRGG